MKLTEATVACIGAGHMGSAVIHGMLHVYPQMTSQTWVLDHNDYKVQPFIESGAHGVTSPSHLENKSFDVVVLALKPQTIPQFLSAHPHVFEDALVISLAVGMKTHTLQAMLPASSRIVRVLPNMPVQIACGVSAVCTSSSAKDGDLELARELFETIGSTVMCEEEHMDLAGVLSGSSPAFFAQFAQNLVEQGIVKGMPAQKARKLVIDTMLGTARLLSETEEHPLLFVESVTSPGGTTVQGIMSMKDYPRYAQDIVDAALKRSKELSGDGE